MTEQANVAPVIIKRKKGGGGDGHHGGAWKVAYADFVTAMMAFFMLMWLLNATTEKQRKGIADYFSPTIPIHRISGGGDGAFGGDSITSEDALALNGKGASQTQPTEARRARGEIGLDPDGQQTQDTEEVFSSVEALLQGKSGESMVADELLRHIVTRVTDEGLIIELYELDGLSLFDPETDTPTRLMQDLAEIVFRAAELVQNDLALGGHVRAQPVVLADNPVWDLSAARADRVRRMLEAQGTDATRMRRVTGYADRIPAVDNPMASRNNRIEVVLLRR